MSHTVTRDGVGRLTFIHQSSGSRNLQCLGILWKEVGGADKHSHSRPETAVL